MDLNRDWRPEGCEGRRGERQKRSRGTSGCSSSVRSSPLPAAAWAQEPPSSRVPARLSSPSTAAQSPAQAPHTCRAVTLTRHPPSARLRSEPDCHSAGTWPTRWHRPAVPEPPAHPGAIPAARAHARCLWGAPAALRASVRGPGRFSGLRREWVQRGPSTGSCHELPCPALCPAWGLSRVPPTWALCPVRPPQAQPTPVSSHVSVTRAAPPSCPDIGCSKNTGRHASKTNG